MLIAALGLGHSSNSGGTHTGSIGSLIVGLLFVITGGLQALNPQLIWKLHRRQYPSHDVKEPTKTSLAVQRATGVLAVGVGIAIIVNALS